MLKSQVILIIIGSSLYRTIKDINSTATYKKQGKNDTIRSKYIS